MLRRICRPMTICRSDLPLGMSPLRGTIPGESLAYLSFQSLMFNLQFALSGWPMLLPLGEAGRGFSISNVRPSTTQLTSHRGCGAAARPSSSPSHLSLLHARRPSPQSFLQRSQEPMALFRMRCRRRPHRPGHAPSATAIS